MNKKVVLSVLSTAVVASLATSAFAAPSAGLYIGGNVDKYYSLTDFVNNEVSARGEINSVGLDNVLYIDSKGNGATVKKVALADSLNDALTKVTLGDFAGNVYTNAKTGEIYDPAKDFEAPTGDLKVEGVSAINSLTVDVKFGTAVDKSTAENPANYGITAVGGTALTVASAKLQADGVTVRLTLGTGTALKKVATNYTVHIHDVLNTNGDEIEEFSKVLTLSDSVRPQVKATSFADTNTFKVEFSEPVDLTNLDNAVTVYDGLTSVQVDLTPDTTKTSFTVDVSGLDSKKEYKLVINSQIVDFAGNAITPNPYETTIKPVADTVDPVVDSITPVNLSYFKVKFNEKIKDQGAGVYFNVAIDDQNVTPVITPVDDSNNTEFVVRLAGNVAKGLHKVTVKNFQDVAGNPNPNTKSTFTKYVDFQDAAPTFTTTTGVVKNVAGTNYVVFKFANPIASTNITSAVAAKRVADGVTFDTTIAANLFKVKAAVSGLAEDEIAIDASALDTGSYTLTLPASVVTDAYGNTNAATALDFTVGTASAQTQVVATATEPTGTNPINGDAVTGESVDQVIVKFSAEVGDSAKDVANYSVEGQRVFKSAEFYGDKQTVRLTLSDDAIKYNGNYVLAISGIKDKNNKDVKAYSSLVKFAENVKPFVAGAEVNALNTVKVIFNEPIVPTGTLDKDDLNVYVNGSKVALTTADFSSNTAIVTLTEALTSTTAKVEVETSSSFDGQDANGNFGKKGSKVEATWKVVDNSDAIAAAKNALDTAIGAAETKANNAVEGTNPGQYAKADIDDLKAAITTAKGVSAKTNATEQELKDAKTTLEAAVTTFENKVVKAAVTTVAVSGADSVTIPTGDTPASEVYTAVVKDQAGNAMDTEEVAWTIKEGTVTGVQLTSDGTLTIDKTAQPGTVTVVATSSTNDTVFAEKAVVVLTP